MLADSLRRRLRDALDRAVQAFPEFLCFHRNRQKLRFTCALELLRAACAFDFVILRSYLCINIDNRFKVQKLFAGHTFRPNSSQDSVQLRFNDPRLAVVLPVFSVQFNDTPHAADAFNADNHAVLVLQVFIGDNIARKDILIDENAVVHGDRRLDPRPCATFKYRLLVAEAQDCSLLRSSSESLSPDYDVGIVRGQLSQQIGQRRFTPAVFSENECAWAKGGVSDRLAFLKATNVLNVLDFLQRERSRRGFRC